MSDPRNPQTSKVWVFEAGGPVGLRGIEHVGGRYRYTTCDMSQVGGAVGTNRFTSCFCSLGCTAKYQVMMRGFASVYGFPQHTKTPPRRGHSSLYPCCFSRELPKASCLFLQIDPPVRRGSDSPFCFIALNPGARRCSTPPPARSVVCGVLVGTIVGLKYVPSRDLWRLMERLTAGTVIFRWFRIDRWHIRDVSHGKSVT